MIAVPDLPTLSNFLEPHLMNFAYTELARTALCGHINLQQPLYCSLQVRILLVRKKERNKFLPLWRDSKNLWWSVLDFHGLFSTFFSPLLPVISFTLMAVTAKFCCSSQISSNSLNFRLKFLNVYLASPLRCIMSTSNLTHLK